MSNSRSHGDRRARIDNRLPVGGYHVPLSPGFITERKPFDYKTRAGHTRPSQAFLDSLDPKKREAEFRARNSPVMANAAPKPRRSLVPRMMRALAGSRIRKNIFKPLKDQLALNMHKAPVSRKKLAFRPG